MKLRWKMLLQLGLTSFLLMTAVLLFTLDYTICALREIRKEGDVYAKADLRRSATNGSAQLRDQIIDFYARAASLEVMKDFSTEAAKKFVRERIPYAGETDIFLYGKYEMTENHDPAFTDLFCFEKKDGKIVEEFEVDYLLTHSLFSKYLQTNKDVKHPIILWLPNHSGEIWSVVNMPPKDQKKGSFCAVRFSQSYLNGGAMKSPSGYMAYHGEKYIFGSMDNLKNPLPEKYFEEIKKIASGIHENSSTIISELVVDNDSGNGWFITGTAIRTGVDTPVIKMVRIYDYVNVMPKMTKMMDKKIQRIRFYVFSFIIAGLLILAVSMIIFSRQISRPLSRAAVFADQLSRGDFTPTQWIMETGITEVDRMMKALSYMRDRLNSNIEKLKKSHTRELEARADAENANRLKSDCLDAISKEYEGPLSSLTTLAGSMNERIASGQPTETQELKNTLDAIAKNLTQLTNMGNLLHKLGDLNLTEDDIKPEETDLFQMIHELNAPAVRLSRKLDMTAEFRYTNDIPYTVFVDRGIMMRMLQMYIDTICYSTPKKTTVLFNCSKQNEILILSCKSTVSNPALVEYKQYSGCKEPLTNFTHVREIIYLTIVKHLATLLNGTLDIIQHTEGGYEMMCTFALSDLAVPANGRVTERAIPTQSVAGQPRTSNCSLVQLFAKIHGRQRNKPVSVLLGEDDGSYKLLLEIMLRGAGCEVCSADSSDQVLEKMKEKMPDIFFLDLRIPVANRCNFLTDIRKLPGAEDLFVFPLAASWDDKEKVRLVSAGADECLEKPFDMNTLTNAVQNACSIRGNIEKHVN